MTKTKTIENTLYHISDNIDFDIDKFISNEIYEVNNGVVIDDGSFVITHNDGVTSGSYKDNRNLITNEPMDTQEIFKECEKNQKVILSFNESELLESLKTCAPIREPEPIIESINYELPNIESSNSIPTSKVGDVNRTLSSSPVCVQELISIINDFTIKVQSESVIKERLISALKEWSIDAFTRNYSDGFDKGIDNFIENKPIIEPKIFKPGELISNIITKLTNELVVDESLLIKIPRLKLVNVNSDKLSGVIFDYSNDLSIFINSRSSILNSGSVDNVTNATMEIVAEEMRLFKRIFSTFDELLIDIFNLGIEIGEYTASQSINIEKINYEKSYTSDTSPMNINTYNKSYDLFISLKNQIDEINNEKDNIESKISNKLSECLDSELMDDENDIINPDDINGYENALDKVKKNPQITNKSYWNKFASIASIINIIPIHWPIGLLIPSPSGVTKIPMPIMWKCIAVIPTPNFMMVVFVGVCGSCPSPFVMIINPSPTDSIGSVGPNSVWFPLALRPMIEIKQDIGSKPSIKPIIPFSIGGTSANIDINPILSLASTFIQDDFPQWERLKLSNLPFVSFLNSFCGAGKKGGGYFENP